MVKPNYTNEDKNRRIVYVENDSDPTQPNYRPSFWYRPLCRWQETQDWFGDIWDTDILCDYLYEKPGEFHKDFANRLCECCPDERFKTAVEDNAAVLNQFEVNEQTFRGFVDAEEDIDLKGKSLKTWDYEMMQRFFRDGVVVVVVDQSQRNSENPTPSNLRPSLKWVPITDIYAPTYVEIDGKPTLVRISIRRDKEEQVMVGGTSTMETVTRYFEYKLLRAEESQDLACVVTVWKENNTGQGIQFEEEESFPINGANGRPLNRLPVEVLSVTSSLDFNREDDPVPPLYSLLKAVIKFTNHESQNDTFEGKVMIPTVNEFLECGETEKPKPLYSGPSRTNIRGAGDRIEVMEPEGKSAKLVYEHQDKRDERISKLDNKFFHLRGGAVTATEAQIENLKSKVKVPALIEKKESLYQEVIKIWRLFSDPGFNGTDESGGIAVSEKAMQMPTDPQDVQNTFESGSLGYLTPQVVLMRLIRIGFLEQEEFDRNEAILGNSPPSPPSQALNDPDEVLG